MVVIIVLRKVVDPETVSFIDAWKRQGKTGCECPVGSQTWFTPDMETLGRSQGQREERIPTQRTDAPQSQPDHFWLSLDPLKNETTHHSSLSDRKAPNSRRDPQTQGDSRVAA